MKNYFLSLLLTAILCVPFNTSAQITIGSGNAPSQWSLLDLCTTNQRLALHNARMTTVQRNALMNYSDEFVYEVRQRARGLLIFNITNNCLEYWNGRRWVSLCEGDTPPQIPVELPPLNANARITTFLNAMYDFQHQQLEAWHTNAGINNSVTNVRWIVSTDNVTFYDILGSTNSAFFRIPVDFIHSFPETVNYLYFRAILTAPAPTGDMLTLPLQMRFIRTTETGQDSDFRRGFGKDANGVRYAVLNRARHLENAANPDTVRVALLNLGASGTGAWRYVDGEFRRVDIGTPWDDRHNLNDAGDMGDFFQWGRVADGHQHIVWRKDANRNNFFGNAADWGGTAGRVDRAHNAANFDADFQVLPGRHGYGLFINSFSGDWGFNRVGINDPTRSLWSNLSEHGRRNNPCPPGWYIPTRIDLGNMHLGTGGTTGGPGSNEREVVGNNNTWVYRELQNNTNARGGFVVTNNFTGAAVFLPAIDQRREWGTPHFNRGFYWTSQSQNETHSWYMGFGSATNTTLQPTINMQFTGIRAHGKSIRCVQH